MTIAELQSRVRFENGQLDDIAGILHRAHPRAAQYFGQAPILVMAAAKTYGSHITYGEVDRFVAAVAAEPRLRDLMASYRLPAATRKLAAVSIHPRHEHALSALAELDASSLSQAIPTDSQGVWLDGIGQWTAHHPRRHLERMKPFLGWFARALGEDLSRYEQVGSLVDYMTRGAGDLNARWSWQRAMQAVEAWHRSLRDEAALRRAISEAKLAKTFDEVICKSALPDVATVEGLTFTPLRTIRRLREEGAEMHHCVASYASSVKHGHSAIIAVKRDGVGIATLEIDRGGRVAQLKGHCNNAPSVETRRACDVYALLHWKAPAQDAAA